MRRVKKKSIFVDLNESQFTEASTAADGRGYIKLVHSAVAGSDEEAQAEARRLALDLADLTDGVSLTTTNLKLPLALRAGIDAVIGACAGQSGWIEITDKELAKRMGRSTKTVQNWRAEFRAWKDHTSLVEVKEHWRDPETKESHPHAYRCHISGFAVDATIEARLSPEYAKDRLMALRKAAHTISREAANYPARPAKKRKPESLNVALNRKMSAVSKKLEEVEAFYPFVPNPDFDELYRLREQIAKNLAAVDALLGLQTSTLNTYKEQVEIAPPATPDGSALESRVEVENQVETRGVVEETFHLNESTESTTYEKPPEKPPLRVVYDEDETYVPAGASDEEIDAAYEKKRSGRAWADLEDRFKPQGGVQP